MKFSVMCPVTGIMTLKTSCMECNEKDICDTYKESVSKKNDELLVVEDVDEEGVDQGDILKKKMRKRQLMFALLGIVGIAMFFLAVFVIRYSFPLGFAMIIIGGVLMWIEAVRGYRSDIKNIKTGKNKIVEKIKSKFSKKKQEFNDSEVF